MKKSVASEWLLIFYSVPSQPVSNRMKIWRKLAKVGAVQLKGAVYILPFSEEHEELFQWFINEVKAMGGDGAFVKTSEIKNINDADIQTLFTRQVIKEYHQLEKSVDVIERKTQNIRKAADLHENRHLLDQAVKLTKDFSDIVRRDFFLTPEGIALKKRIQVLETGLRGTGTTFSDTTASITLRRAKDFQGMTWATRKNPFVDRMASAWLIKRFVDPKASFIFIDERDISTVDKAAITFDMRGAAFTHAGDRCTFEVLVKSFGIKDKAVNKIAEIVHDLDTKDDQYDQPEAAGLENILAGIRKTAKNDGDGLERGMAVFEMLYQSKT